MSNPEQKNLARPNDGGEVNVSVGNDAEQRQSERVFLRSFHINDSWIGLDAGGIEETTGAAIYSQQGYFTDFIYFQTTNNRFHVSMEVEHLHEYPFIRTGEPFAPPFPVENFEMSLWGEEVCRIDFDLYVYAFDEDSDPVSVNEFDVQIVGGDSYQLYLRVYLNAKITKGFEMP